MRKYRSRPLHEKLKINRKFLRLTQKEIAEKLGYNSVQFISLMERGLSKIPSKSLRSIAKAYDMRFSLVVKHYRREQIAKLDQRLRKI